MNNISNAWVIVLTLLAIWELIWKGFGLWKSAHNNDLVWFIVILLINSAGVLPIIYLLMHRKDSRHEQGS